MHKKAKTRIIHVAAGAVGAVLFCAVSAQSQVGSMPEVGGLPLNNLTEAQLADFFAGQAEFVRVFDAETGLGPIFNDVSCAACHSDGGLGGSSRITVTRFGRLTNGQFDPLNDLGGSLLQHNAIDPSLQEVIPEEANVTTKRKSTPLFGLGLIEAIPDATIIRGAYIKFGGILGRPAMVVDAATGETRVGRFGWKAQHATLLAFAGDASVNELGITNRLFPHHNLPNIQAAKASFEPDVAVEDVVDEATGKSNIDRLTDFMRFMAPPEVPYFSRAAGSGLQWFSTAACAECHTPVMYTGKSDIPALDRKPVVLFSDLLLHKMGSLGDGIAQEAASPRELRTSPLWGLRAQSSFLHDGRAATIEQAILMHDGEAAGARELFLKNLSRQQQLELLEFLMSI
jgi:CxxC motif-containing protein (DUF1111 family)